MRAQTPEPFTLMLENDCPVLEPPHIVHQRLQEARDWLARGELDACQLRSIPYPGAKFNVCAKYCRYWSCTEQQTALAWRRWLRPLKARRPVQGAQDIERALDRRWWREQDFRIGMSQGFFTHLD
ncbi:MAG: hypothetical protein ACYC3N_02225 [Halothiobacillus sp.]